MAMRAGPGSNRLSFQFLGDFRMQSPAATPDLQISGRTRELFAFLVLNANKTIRRATLPGLIWTDRDERRSRANLNTALWRINRILKLIGMDDIHLLVSADQLKMVVAPSVFIDVLAVEAAVKEAVQSTKSKAPLPLAARDTLIDVLSRDGEFLEGLSSEWVLIERERVFNLQIRGLTLLMQDFAARGQIEEALEYGRCILRMDPMRECIHRLVMWLHVLNGHQANAIRQYLECTRILEHELRVSPMAETRALYDYIVCHNHAAAAVTESPGAGGPAPVRGDRNGADPAIDGYDEELTRLRSLISKLNSHRQSVFSALAETSTV
jgi:DNA-binding SARP family transcriptional activator